MLIKQIAENFYPDNKFTAYDYWEEFLTNRVYDMYTVTGMDYKMEFAFKTYLLLYGRVAFFKYNNELVCQWFNTGGEIGKYPTFYNGVYANPKMPNAEPINFENGAAVPIYLNQTDMFRDAPTCGYSMLIHTTANQLADNTISTSNLQFIKRLPTVFTARTDTEKTAIELMLGKIKQGLKTIVARVPLNDSVKRLDGGQGTALLQEFTEYQQYILGNFYQTIGVNCPWNLKRERVTSTESNQNDEVLRYNIHRQYKQLKEQISIVNETFNTNFNIVLNVDEVRKEQREEVTENERDENIGRGEDEPPNADDSENGDGLSSE